MLLITLTMGNFSPFRPSSLLFLIAVGSIITVGGSVIARFTRFISSVIYVQSGICHFVSTTNSLEQKKKQGKVLQKIGKRGKIDSR